MTSDPRDQLEMAIPDADAPAPGSVPSVRASDPAATRTPENAAEPTAGPATTPGGSAADLARIGRLDFDEAIAELQRTVAELEAGGQSLEASITLYERGVALHERCAALLTEAELRVQRLVERASGALETVDLAADRDDAPEPD